MSVVAPSSLSGTSAIARREGGPAWLARLARWLGGGDEAARRREAAVADLAIADFRPQPLTVLAEPAPLAPGLAAGQRWAVRLDPARGD